MALSITPPYDRYIVEMLPEETEQRTAGGIIIPTAVAQTGAPEDKKAETRRFKVLSRGPGLWNETGVRQPLQYEVGQVVLALKPMEIDGFDFEGRRLYVLAEGSITAGL